MKTILFLFCAIGLSLVTIAQTKGTIKLYGYRQSVSGGKAPEIQEGSNTGISEGGGKNYFLYALSPSRIYPSEIWIEGTRYGVTIKSIAKTPVKYTDEMNIGSPEKVLVPKTSQKLIQLIPVRSMNSKPSGAKAKSLARTNELVVVYQQGGKFYYTALKTLSELESAAMQ